MRREAIAHLDDPPSSRFVKVRELQAAHVRQILADVRERGRAAVDELVGALIEGNIQGALAILGDLVEPSPDVGDTLSFSEIGIVKEKFLEVNSGFFAHSAIQNIMAAMTQTLTTSTAPVASSSNVDTPT